MQKVKNQIQFSATLAIYFLRFTPKDRNAPTVKVLTWLILRHFNGLSEKLYILCKGIYVTASNKMGLDAAIT